ncbi:putative lipoprotein [Lysobacter antibioticus]|nr:putative lipoprotein [Lysobacter antibioticus]
MSIDRDGLVVSARSAVAACAAPTLCCVALCRSEVSREVAVAAYAAPTQGAA